MNLRDFTDQAANDLYELGDEPTEDELELENDEQDAAAIDESEASEAEAAAFWSSLTAEEYDLAEADEEARGRLWNAWLEANGSEGGEADEADDLDSDDGSGPTTGAEFVGWVMANADYIQGEYGMTVGEYLSSMIGLSDREWIAAARAAGIDPASRPSHADLRGYGKHMTGAVFAVDWQRDLQRIKDRGRFLE